MTTALGVDRWLRIKMDSALNTPFSDWGNILFNTTIATAIADRLVENSEIFLLGGDSLRKPSKSPESPAP
jgi:DNA replication protein DnaC